MDAECHGLLKSFCALKGISVSDYCYRLIAADFEKEVKEDVRIRELFLSGTYQDGSNASALKEKIMRERELE